MKQSHQGLGPIPVSYRIKVRGRLDESWSDWLNGMTIEFGNASDGSPTTVLTGRVADQPKLRGILSKIWDLNLTVISVTQIGPEESKRHSQPDAQPGGEQWENC